MKCMSRSQIIPFLLMLFAAFTTASAFSAGVIDDRAWMANQKKIRESFGDDHLGSVYIFGNGRERVSGGCVEYANTRFEDWHCPQLIWSTTIKPYAGSARVSNVSFAGVTIGDTLEKFSERIKGCTEYKHEPTSNFWALGDTKVYCKNLTFANGVAQNIFGFFVDNKLVFMSLYYYERVRLGNVPSVFVKLEQELGGRAVDRTGAPFMHVSMQMLESMQNLKHLSNNPDAYFVSKDGDFLVLSRASLVDIMEGQGFYVQLFDGSFYLNQGARMLRLRDARLGK